MEFRYIHLQRPFRFEPPFESEYVLLLETRPAEDVEEKTLSIAIAGSACRYVLCRGPDSDSWEDTIDLARVVQDTDHGARPLLMTTSHGDEPPEDTVDFMLGCTEFEDFVPSRFAILELGGDGKKLVALRAAVEQATRDA